jgi:GH18 family chitinase
MQIGSWSDEKRLTGTQFSKFLDMPKARERFVNALANYLQQNSFEGVLISWYYPGCVRVRFIFGKRMQSNCLFYTISRMIVRQGQLKMSPTLLFSLKKLLRSLRKNQSR